MQILSFDFVIWLRTFRFEFSSEYSIFVIFLFIRSGVLLKYFCPERVVSATVIYFCCLPSKCWPLNSGTMHPKMIDWQNRLLIVYSKSFPTTFPSQNQIYVYDWRYIFHIFENVGTMLGVFTIRMIVYAQDDNLRWNSSIDFPGTRLFFCIPCLDQFNWTFK